MQLKKLNILNFRNHSQLDFQFTNQINCFVGNNGVGKTNLLDTIYYLANCKSYFNSIDSQNIKHQEDFFVLQGSFIQEDEELNIYCGVKRNSKKKFTKNKVEYERLANHIGLINTVIITPYDINLIHEGSEIRRKFLDLNISLVNREYLQSLIKYNRLISQRNALLKQNIGRNSNYENYKIWDEQIIQIGQFIHEKRKEFVHDFQPIFKKYYQQISNDQEKAEISYKSDLLDQEYEKLISDSFPRDSIVGYTSKGIHKEDLNFIIDNYSIKKMASQGQQKSYLIALKLAQYEFIQQKTDSPPILLLDDIFDRLDKSRISTLINTITQDKFGQIFITDTNSERLEEVIESKTKDYRIFQFPI